MTLSMDSVSILGLRVSRLSTDQALQFVTDAVARRDAPRHIVTADASMAVIARQDAELRAIVAGADLVTPDGAGILWASRLLRFARDHVRQWTTWVRHRSRPVQALIGLAGIVLLVAVIFGAWELTR